MNILCNPTGTNSRFRAIDWLVEHNNLYTKVSISSTVNKYLSEGTNFEGVSIDRGLQEHTYSA
jgi:hypothetical protein